MKNIKLIASGINKDVLKIKVHDIDCICSFTGEQINKAVSNKDLIKKTFTDHSFKRYSSDYSSLDAAVCIAPVIQGKKGLNSLRSYSYLAVQGRLTILSREDVLDLILNLPKDEFVLAVTYSNKKHTTYKSVVNTSSDVFTVTTDIGNVVFNLVDVKKLLPIIQSWYCIVDGKESTAAMPTYFTKKDILNGCGNHNKIKLYGLEKYFRENSVIKKYRDTEFLKLLVHILNKTNHVKD